MASLKQKRIKIRGNLGGFHVVSRVIHREFLLNEHMRRYFAGLVSHLSWLYEARIFSWTIMENHFHINLSFRLPEEIDAEYAVKRWNRYHKNKHQKNPSVEEDRRYVAECLTDISHFMKKLNTLMTREYNRSTGHVGTLWERRFRSSVVQYGRAMLMSSAYIELNSFRASLSARPEDYPYCSLYYLRKGNPGDVLDVSSLGRWLHIGEYPENTQRKRTGSHKKNSMEKAYIQELYKKYVEYIYRQGSKAPRRKLIQGRTDGIKITEEMQKRLDERFDSAEAGYTDMEESAGGAGREEQKGVAELKKGVGLCRRIGMFTQGKFLGSRRFAGNFYNEHVDPGYEKAGLRRRHKRRWLHGMSGGLWGVFNGSGRKQHKGDESEKEIHKELLDGDGGQRGSPPTPT